MLRLLCASWQATDVEGLEDHLGQFVGDGEHLVWPRTTHAALCDSHYPDEMGATACLDLISAEAEHAPAGVLWIQSP